MGGLRRITLFELPGDPAPHADQCQIYAKDDSGRTELFFMDQSGATTQITKDGYLDVQYEADVLGLPYELVDPASGESKGSIYTKKISGNVELFYIDSSENVIQLTENGSIKEDAILVDSIYYVDGDSGSDNNDGLTWGTAKKTMAFLYSGNSDALPRELKANLTIQVRGTVLSQGISYHTIIDKFFGFGKITITGSITDVVIDLTPTGWDNNSSSSITAGTYLEVSGATWTIDEYRGHFIQFTTPSSDVLFPIQSNTSTRLETIDLPLTIDGNARFKIVSVPQLKGAQVSDPSTLISNYSGMLFANSFINCLENHICVRFKNLDITNHHLNINIPLVMDDDGNNSVVLVSEYTLENLVINGLPWFVKGVLSCNRSLHILENSSDGWYGEELTNLLFNSSCFVGTTGTGLWVDYASIKAYSCRFTGVLNAFTAIKSQVSSYNNFYDGVDPFYCVDCDISLGANTAAPERFKNLTTCVNLISNRLLVNNEVFPAVLKSNCTYDIITSDDQAGHYISYLFTDVAALKPISNATNGAAVVYHTSDRKPVGDYEYDNTTSGLDGYSYQEAIDELALRSIEVDTTYYVDGDVGSDFNDGLTWGTAKKTFAFLYSGDEDALPREINARVTIRSRGYILSKTADRHTLVDSFYGSGEIYLIGEFEDIITNQTITGYDNTVSSVTYRSYIENTGASWGVDDYRGMFIQFTSPASDDLYPILKNSSTKIESTWLPILNGSEVFKVVRASTKLKAATVADPDTIINFYPGYRIFETKDCYIPLYISGLEHSSGTYGGTNNYFGGGSVGTKSDFATITSGYVTPSTYIKNCIFSVVFPHGIGVYYKCCSFVAIGNNDVGLLASYDSTTGVLIDGCIFDGIGQQGTGGLNPFYPSYWDVSNSRFYNYDYAIYSLAQIIFVISNTLIEECDVGIRLNKANWYCVYQTNRFKNNDICIDLSGTTLFFDVASCNFYSSGNNKEIIVANYPGYVSFTFSQLVLETPIYNTKNGALVSYYKDTGYFDLIDAYEYINTTSGLTSVTYQDAIDELNLEKTQKSSGTITPNGSVSGNIGDIYIDTLYDISYINIDGTNTGWRVM